VELLIGILVLAVAAFFVVRGMQQAKERAQRQQITAALNEWWDASGNLEEAKKAAQTIFALVEANPRLHHVKSNFGWTPLHVASVYDNLQIVQLILDHGADINAKDNDGNTSRHGAALNGRKAVAELLLAKGADASARTNHGLTPYGLAKHYGRQEIIDLLLKHGAKER